MAVADDAQDREQAEERRIALVLEYEGTAYNGFQFQANAPSVQGTVEDALKSFTGEVIRIRGASRTDSGAHAAGQVADFLTQAPYPTDIFCRALNSFLPPDIRVRGAVEMPRDFSARFSAVSRVYRYTAWNHVHPPALWRNFSYWVRDRLDLTAMREASESLLGAHDFSTIASSLSPGRNPVRTVRRWDMWREDERVIMEAEGDSFLPHQIRRTNALLVRVGLGKLPVDAIRNIIDRSVQKLDSCPSLPARGLCLIKVNYPGFSSDTLKAGLDENETR
jgi:tRNA pseudouridine38-40 synthase